MFPADRSHEDVSADIVLSPDVGIGSVIDAELSDHGVTKERVASLIKGGVHEAGFIRELISSPWDVDKMDYLLRDSMYCGVEYGKYDVGRIMDSLILFEEPQGDLKLAIDSGGVHAIEGFVLARYFMFTQVYFHDVRRVYDWILAQFIAQLLQENLGREQYPEDLREYLQWDDNRILAAAGERQAEGDGLAERLLSRHHLKAVYETSDHPDPIIAQKAFFQLPEHLERQFPGTTIWADKASDHPERFRKDPLPVLQGGRWQAISTISRVLQGLEEINQVRVYADVRGDTSLEDKVAESCRSFMS